MAKKDAPTAVVTAAILSTDQERERLRELERTYLLLFRERGRILEACTPAEQQQFLDTYAAARVALTTAVADGVANNDPVVAQFHRDLEEVNDKIEDALHGLRDIVAFLGLVTEAVKLMAAVAALGA